jgi:mRNA interferase MazF
MAAIKRGEVYWVNMDPAIGAEIKKLRPALVISNDINNQHSPLVTILPISSNINNPYPFEVFVAKGEGGLMRDGLIKANQIRTVDKKRISGSAVGPTLNSQLLQQVDQAVKIHLSLS